MQSLQIAKSLSSRAPQWNLWKATLETAFLPPHAVTKRLSQCLGSWAPNQIPIRAWWYSPFIIALFHHESGNVLETMDLCQPTTASTTPQHSPSVQTRQSSRCHSRVYRTLISYGPPNRAYSGKNTIHQRLTTLPPDLQSAIAHLQSTDDGSTIAEAIRQEGPLVVCDGSLKYGYGTAPRVLDDEVTKPHKQLHVFSRL